MLFERTTELPSEQHQGFHSCTAQYKNRENKPHRIYINYNPGDKTMYTSQMFSHLKKRESPFCSLPPLTDNVHQYKEIDNSGLRPPAHPQFSLLCNRLKTFNSWPRNLHQKPNDLAAAGFFYPGTADIVTCFSCGGSLKEWEPEDEPIIEHAHWFPSCNFLIQTKGENFIRQAQLKNQDDDASDAIKKTDDYNAADNVACCEPQTQSPPLLKTNTKNDTIDVVLKTPAAQSVMMMGYTREITIQAIEKCLHAGKSKPSAVEIMQILFDMEEEEEESGNDEETETENIQGETGNRYQSTMEGGNEEENNNTYSQCTEEPLTSNTVYRSLSPVSTCDLPRPIEENFKSLSVQQEPIPQPFSKLELNQMNDLVEENRKLRESNKCKVCLDKDSNTVFLPCGHLATCAECAASLIKCPLCRQHIHGTVRVYLA